MAEKSEPSKDIPPSQTLVLILDFRHYGWENTLSKRLQINLHSLCQALQFWPDMHLLRTANVVEGDIDVETTAMTFPPKRNITASHPYIFGHVNGDPCSDPDNTLLIYIRAHKIRRIIVAGLYTEVTLERLARGLDMWGSSSEADIERHGGNAAMASAFRWDPANYGENKGKPKRGKKRTRQEDDGGFFDRGTYGWDGQLIVAEDVLEPCQWLPQSLGSGEVWQSSSQDTWEADARQEARTKEWNTEVRERLKKMKRKLGDYEFRGGFQRWTFMNKTQIVGETRQDERFRRAGKQQSSRQKLNNKGPASGEAVDLTRDESSAFEQDTSPEPTSPIPANKPSAADPLGQRRHAGPSIPLEPLEQQHQLVLRHERALNEAKQAAQDALNAASSLTPQGSRSSESLKENRGEQRSKKDRDRVATMENDVPREKIKRYDHRGPLGKGQRLSREGVQNTMESGEGRNLSEHAEPAKRVAKNAKREERRYSLSRSKKGKKAKQT
ncbi:MAG: hypothetical protein M1831_007462 [Alyxoria varia]|nr:MAG: hypothetical protein M1831_007462 [Alyxoria varia]